MVKADPKSIQSFFEYRTDGTLMWKVNTGKKRLLGTVAGWARGPDGYQRVGLCNRCYYVHHIVWAWHHGEWPSKRIDHANGNPRDNRIENLREASQSQNLANSKARKRDYPKGVTPVRDASTFNAHITVNYKNINLGNYRTEKAAHDAYMAAAIRYFGEFARAV